LGGDTEKAAKIADRAITDMSDNSNKFGTNMQSVMNAYQGFAKQNYTLLDNLKLGYGGTQAEMARLINDSGVLGESIKVTDDTVKDVPFDKVIEAIGKIQDRLGVTGTTAKEAASTFSGSMSSMKAAAKNLLGTLSTGGNVKEATDNFVSTAKIFLKDNFLPMLSTILRSAGTLIAEAVRNLPQLIWEVISGLSFEDAATLAATAFGLGMLRKLKKYLSNDAGDHWSSIQKTIGSKVGENAESAGTAIGSKICAGIGAFMAGWEIGSWIYAKWGKQIDENFLHPLYNKVENFFDSKSNSIDKLESEDERINRIADTAVQKVLHGNEFGSMPVKIAEERTAKMTSDANSLFGTNATSKLQRLMVEDSLGARSWGNDLSKNFAGGIYEGSALVVDAASSVASGIKSVIGFSEPEKGPLSDFHTYAPDMMQSFADGISQNRYLVENEVTDMMGAVKSTMTDPINSPSLRVAGTASGDMRTIKLQLVDNYGRIVAEGITDDVDLIQGETIELSERRLA
jgi:hypothetical protein